MNKSRALLLVLGVGGCHLFYNEEALPGVATWIKQPGNCGQVHA